MQQRLSLYLALLFLTVGGLGFLANAVAADPQPQPQPNVVAQLVARERAAVAAWQRRDRAFYENYLAEDATYFGPMNPYLEIEPRVNFLPKFERMTEMFKITEFEIYNPRAQVYGDIAILTYNSAVLANIGGRTMHYTGKMTVVYRRQGNDWRVVHGHESMNPGAQ